MEFKDIVFEFDDYLIQNGWNKRHTIWRKGKKSIYVTDSGLMIALNNKEGIKHRHIVTCETPCDFFEAQVIFKKCRLNFNNNEDDSNNEC
jgi:hypothetical protein